MRLPLPEPIRDPDVFQPLFEEGMRVNPRRKENYELSKRCGRDTVAAAMPIMLDVEPTSRCNYRCLMCAVSTWKGQKRAEDMGLDLFRLILDEQYGAYEIKLQGLGEPLLNGSFCEMVAMCRERHIWTRTTVNGSLLHVDDTDRRVLEAGIGEIQVSVDGADKEVYERIRPGGNFELLVRNCRRLNQLAARMRPTAASRAFALIQRENVAQMEKMVEFCAHMEFQRMIFSLDIGWFGLEEIREPARKRNVKNEIAPTRCLELVELGKRLGIEVTFWQGGDKYSTDAPETLCGWLWNRAFISSEGRIVPCCTVCDPRIIDLGDARHFASAWNDGPYQTLRAAHLAGKMPAVCQICY